MSGDVLRAHADRFLTVLLRHPECCGGRVTAATEARATVELDINVEMPLHMKADGCSPNGVRRTETVQGVLGPSYPWLPPTFYLRPDFPRDLPHLQPDAPDVPPRPCLVDGNQREYFLQFGLVEAGVFHLLHQLVLWLQRAAEGTLIDPEQGWEPTLRRNLSDFLVVDAEACRALVDRNGGYRIFKSHYHRLGTDSARLSDGAIAFLGVSADRVPLNRDDKQLFTFLRGDESTSGSTICCVIWSNKLSSGEPFVADTYLPETVTTLDALRRRADELRCGASLQAAIGSLERYFRGRILRAPIPIGVILCIRRPFHLIGSTSDIELLPYVFELRADAGRTSLFAGGDEEPVGTAVQLDVTNPALLRSVSGSAETGPVALLGCGSVGSKMAMHLARSGVSIPVVCDRGVLRPHNMARHGLARSPLAGYKSDELAAELAHLGQAPQSHKVDLVRDLMTRQGRRTILPKRAAIALNTTASLGVREALSALAPNDLKLRLAEAALFGHGHGAFLLIAGKSHNPTLADLVTELYATIETDRLRSLLFDQEYGLTEIQIGQGCGSLTMRMTDMRLSTMTASLTEMLMESMEADDEGGQIAVGITAEASHSTDWFRQSVAPFEVVPIESADGWSLRVSQRVMEKIRAEVRFWPTVETGGVLIGTCSARLRAIIVVDLISAPADSVRSEGGFTLGTEGLKEAIAARHQAAGGSLFDVGTWHSHLANQGPSPRDRETARELAAARPPPSVLFIVARDRLHALMHSGART